MTDAPERIWTGLKGTINEDDWYEYLPEGESVEYVRADLYDDLNKQLEDAWCEIVFLLNRTRTFAGRDDD